jgi:hypothetical protein
VIDLFFLVQYGVSTGELRNTWNFPGITSPDLLVSLALSSIMGSSLGFAQLYCTRQNSPLTTTGIARALSFIQFVYSQWQTMIIFVDVFDVFIFLEEVLVGDNGHV